MISFFISILIVYGITNILVYGSIFENIKTKFRFYVYKLKNKDVTPDMIWTYKNNSEEYKILYDQFIELQISLSSDQSDEVINSFEQAKKEQNH